MSRCCLFSWAWSLIKEFWVTLFLQELKKPLLFSSLLFSSLLFSSLLFSILSLSASHISSVFPPPLCLSSLALTSPHSRWMLMRELFFCCGSDKLVKKNKNTPQRCTEWSLCNRRVWYPTRLCCDKIKVNGMFIFVFTKNQRLWKSSVQFAQGHFVVNPLKTDRRWLDFFFFPFQIFVLYMCGS